jgi:hypothetical protein
VQKPRLQNIASAVAVFERAILAVPIHTTPTHRDLRAPGCITISSAGRSSKQRRRCKSSATKCQFRKDFQHDDPSWAASVCFKRTPQRENKMAWGFSLCAPTPAAWRLGRWEARPREIGWESKSRAPVASRSADRSDPIKCYSGIRITSVKADTSLWGSQGSRATWRYSPRSAAPASPWLDQHAFLGRTSGGPVFLS